MTTRKSNTRARLRKIKRYYQGRCQQWQEQVQQGLSRLDQQLYELRCSQMFYHHSVQALMYHEDRDLMFGLFLVSEVVLEQHRAVEREVAQMQSETRLI